MNHADIFFSANEQLRLTDLIPVDKSLYKNLQKGYLKETLQDMSYEKWKKSLKKLGYDADRIYMNPNRESIRHFFYVGEYYTAEIHTLEPDWLRNEFSIGVLKKNDIWKEHFEKKEYELFFFPEWNLFALDYFIRFYKQIEKEKLWEVFKSMYTLADYGFAMFPEEVLEEVFAYADNTKALTVLKEKEAIDKDGYLTIYRGEGKRSTPLKKAYSWSLSYDIANRFANHFEKGKIYKGKVKAERILDYDNNRNEEEILVRFTAIEDLETMQDVLK